MPKPEVSRAPSTEVFSKPLLMLLPSRVKIPPFHLRAARHRSHVTCPTRSVRRTEYPWACPASFADQVIEHNLEAVARSRRVENRHLGKGPNHRRGHGIRQTRCSGRSTRLFLMVPRATLVSVRTAILT